MLFAWCSGMLFAWWAAICAMVFVSVVTGVAARGELCGYRG